MQCWLVLGGFSISLFDFSFSIDGAFVCLCYGFVLVVVMMWVVGEWLVFCLPCGCHDLFMIVGIVMLFFLLVCGIYNHGQAFVG